MAKQQNETTVVEVKEQSTINNAKAHAIGIKWGKEVQKRNGADIKHLRAAMDIITDVRDIADVVKAYKEAGGDNATASRIKKILVSSFEDPAARAIVYDESSNSLQGCYKKIRELEKGTETIVADSSNEEEVSETQDDDVVEVPDNVDMTYIMTDIDNMIEIIGKFDSKGVKMLKKVKERMATYCQLVS